MNITKRLDCRRLTGFTLVELLVVIAIIGVLTSLLLPAISKSKQKARAVMCVSNLKQMQLAWTIYANDDEMPLNHSVNRNGIQQSDRGSWVVGNAQHDTNTLNIEAGSLFASVGSTKTYRCPSDNSTVFELPSVSRSRSYSLFSPLRGARSGSSDGLDWSENIYGERKARLGDVVNPSEGIAFIEDHEESIDDGLFAVLNPIAHPDAPWVWYELPSDRHGQGCNFSFVDGHVQRWKWLFPKRFLGHGQAPAPAQVDPHRYDLQDLQRFVRSVPRSSGMPAPAN